MFSKLACEPVQPAFCLANLIHNTNLQCAHLCYGMLVCSTVRRTPQASGVARCVCAGAIAGPVLQQLAPAGVYAMQQPSLLGELGHLVPLLHLNFGELLAMASMSECMGTVCGGFSSSRCGSRCSTSVAMDKGT